MNVQGTDRIAFRFSRGEIAALLKLMNASALPEINLTAAEPDARTESSLVESGIVIPCGERTFVDRTIAAVLRNAVESRCSLCAVSEKGRLAIYRGTQMYVLAEESRLGLVVMEPFANAGAAREPFWRAVGMLGADVELTFRREGAETSGDFAALETLYARMEGQ